MEHSIFLPVCAYQLTIFPDPWVPGIVDSTPSENRSSEVQNLWFPRIYYVLITSIHKKGVIEIFVLADRHDEHPRYLLG